MKKKVTVKTAIGDKMDSTTKNFLNNLYEAASDKSYLNVQYNIDKQAMADEVIKNINIKLETIAEEILRFINNQ